MIQTTQQRKTTTGTYLIESGKQGRFFVSRIYAWDGTLIATISTWFWFTQAEKMQRAIAKFEAARAAVAR